MKQVKNKKVLGRFAHPTKLVRVAKDLHQLLKEDAVKTGQTMSLLLDEVIKEYYQIGYRPEDYQNNGMEEGLPEAISQEEGIPIIEPIKS